MSTLLSSIIILLVGIVSNSNAAPMNQLNATVCERIMADGGLTPDFSHHVVHRLHSLTLEDLRYYFKPDATEDNNIPTVNLDLDSDVRVLPNTPLYGYDTTSFISQGNRHVDQVLRNMDTDNSLTNFSILDKVAHAMHMGELWSRAKVYFDALTLMPPSNEVCSCVRDIHNNGLLQELHLLALKIKYPGITSGNYQPIRAQHSSHVTHQQQDDAPSEYDVSYVVSYLKGIKGSDLSSSTYRRALQDFDFSGNEADVVARVAKELIDGDFATIFHLGNEEGWKLWKEDVNSMNEFGTYEFAVFMFCNV